MNTESNPLLYPRSTEPFDFKAWREPAKEYRGAPFWSWNGKLNADKLVGQLEFMKAKMGMGGAYLHPRTGLDTEYMGPEYLDIMAQCVDYCRANNMLASLYDEDRWPSGAAGGLVTHRNPDFRQMHLLVTIHPYGQLPRELRVKNPSKGQVQRSENGSLLAAFDVKLLQDGCIEYTRLQEGEIGANQTFFFYLESQPPEPWWNYGTYVDTLNPEAVRLFIELTHERYHSRFKDDFGKTIPSIFMDEPQTTRKETREVSSCTKDLFLPWTWALEGCYTKEYGSSLIGRLPELVWDTSTDPNPTRYQYHELLARMFDDAFNKQIFDWCRSANIMLTGHMNGEPTLTTQTQYIGEAMRCYAHMHMPGIDILCDGREYNTAKQAVSVARQKGAKAVLSELYGVTNWTFTFCGHKSQGDWQAALGVTNRVHHLFPYSIAGESKRDYPAAIGYQSPWASEYQYIEDHFARVTNALTRGSPITRVAVIHPIESFWLTWGPVDRHGPEHVWREHAFQDLTHWLLHGLIDFDFISESLFVSQTPDDLTSKRLHVGKCTYDVVIVPNLRTIRSTTLQRLDNFTAAGGTVIYTGGVPGYIDLKKATIDSTHTVVPFTRKDVLAALDHYRDIQITSRGVQTDSLFYQLRQDGQDRYLFICDTDRWDAVKTEIGVKGNWNVTVLDTLKGHHWNIVTEYRKDWTWLSWTFHACGSLLLRLTPRSSGKDTSADHDPSPALDYENGINQIDSVILESVQLSEPNALLLDFASWRLDEGVWQPVLEILKIDNAVRQQLGLPLKKDAFPQPWNLDDEDRVPVSKLDLKFSFKSDISLPDVKLAIENIQNTEILLDGQTISSERVGWYIDVDISVIRLGHISEGDHTLQLTIAFGRTTPIERLYLLGEFGVSLYGRVGVLTSLHHDRLSFGDITRQGMPFYTGNIVYMTRMIIPNEGRYFIQLYHFDGPAVIVEVEGTKHNLSLPPHVADLGLLSAGTHSLRFTIFGNRENAMGAIHMPPGKTDWWAPNAWRGEQQYWQNEYDIKPFGLTSAPSIAVIGPREYTVPIRRRHIDQRGMERRFH